ncbi:hypothetical protein A7982_13986 [Minicystis rosea]|nr:hypothetical protein A7982_13986 [Minicystis rosea]
MVAAGACSAAANNNGFTGGGGSGGGGTSTGTGTGTGGDTVVIESDASTSTPCESAKENKSTIGCDYYAVNPDSVESSRGGCYAAFIANTWGAPITIQVERGGQTLDATSFSYLSQGTGQSITYQPLPGGQLPPGQVAIVFLASVNDPPAPSCPPSVNVAQILDPAVHGTGLGAAFHITTSAPVVAYDIFPYGGGQSATTSATLLLPTTAWDTNYIAVDAFRKSKIPKAQPSIDIVAAEDGTEVTISPTAAITAGPGVAPTEQGQPQTYHLDKGQILQFTQDAELTGSPIQANKPVGVWGGASCLSVDIDVSACDSAHQQIPPVKALGSEYVAVRYRNRFDGQEESPPWRMVGAVKGTTLTWEPSQPPNAPSTLDVGQIAEFRAPGPFTVKSQDVDHPFYMSAYMTGCEELNPAHDDCRGDPEFVNVIPSLQYLSSYVFFTDPTYPETNLVLVRRNDGDGFKDVTLDCAGKLTGWQPIGSGGKYEYTRVDLVRHDFQPQGSCDNGRHEIHSDTPFGLVVWGWGSAESVGFPTEAVSYAYPAGASVLPINTVSVLPIPK